MTYTLTQNEYENLQNAYLAAEAGTNSWANVYATILNAISGPSWVVFTGPKDGVEPAAWQWVNGAYNVNLGVGVYSEYIRTYSQAQYIIRFGDQESEMSLQDVSNLVCKNVSKHILDNNGSMPSLHQIGENDAGATIAGYFKGDAAGWSGNPLFAFLGDTSFFYETILEDQKDAYDLMAYVKSTASALGEVNSIGDYISLTLNTLSVMFGNGISGDLSNITNSLVSASQDLFSNIYNYYSLQDILANGNINLGTLYDDEIHGINDVNYINGGAGDDIIDALNFSDLIDGGYGNDVISGGVLDLSNYPEYGIADLRQYLQTGSFFTEEQSGWNDGVRDDLYGGAGSDILVVGGGVNATNTTFTTSQIIKLNAIDLVDGADLDYTVCAQWLPYGELIPNSIISAKVNSIDISSADISGEFIVINGSSKLYSDQYQIDQEGQLRGRILTFASGETIMYVSAQFNSYTDVVLFGVNFGKNFEFNLGGRSGRTIQGSANDDAMLAASDGSDAIFSDSGNDIVDAGSYTSGYDQFDGGDGIDTISYENSTDDLEITYNSASGAFDVSSANWDQFGADDDEFTDFERIVSGRGNDVIAGSALDETFVIIDGDDSIDGGGGLDTLDFSMLTAGINVNYTFVGSGTAFSADGNQITFTNVTNIIGGDGNDVIVGDTVGNSINGNKGDDILEGGGGNDSYSYASGDGNDTVTDTGGDEADIDVLILTDLTSSDIGLIRNGDDLKVQVLSTGHIIVVTNQFGPTGDGIETIRFADESSLDRTAILAAVTPDVAVEIPTVTVSGTYGDDTLDGTWGDDVFEGGLGNDLLLGSAGSDTYLYALGDGNDYIDDEAGFTDNTDVLLLTNLNSDDISLARNGVHLEITILTTGHVITIDEQFYSDVDYWGIEKIQFANGSFMDRDNILASVDTELPTVTIQGTSGNDTLEGTWDDDVFDGGLGNDLLQGSAGSDTYIYASGDGNDYIDDEAGFTDNTDVLLLTDLNADDISLARNGVHLEITVIATGHTITIDEQFYSDVDYWGIEKIRFADGSFMDRDDILDAVTPSAVRMSTPQETGSDLSPAETSDSSADTDLIVFDTGALDSITTNPEPNHTAELETTSSDNQQSSAVHSAEIISLSDYLGNSSVSDQSDDLWYQPEPIGVVV